MDDGFIPASSNVRDPRTTPLGVRWRARDVRQQCGSAEICGHLPRKQRVVVVNGPRQRKTLEQPVKVAIGIDAPGFAGFDQAVEVCTCVRPRYGVAKKPERRPTTKGRIAFSQGLFEMAQVPFST